MPLPVISDVFRVAFSANLGGGGTCANVLHVSAPAASATDVLDVIKATPDADNWYTEVVASDNFLITVTPLDGVSASVQDFAENLAGESTGETVYEASIVLKLHTPLRGREHRGRQYIGPLPEGALTAGVVSSTAVGFTLDRFRTAVASWLLADPVITLGVASYKDATFEAVDLVSATQQQRTQRRRLRRVTGR